jgi:hypothetical protein
LIAKHLNLIILFFKRPGKKGDDIFALFSEKDNHGFGDIDYVGIIERKQVKLTV